MLASGSARSSIIDNFIVSKYNFMISGIRITEPQTINRLMTLEDLWRTLKGDSKIFQMILLICDVYVSTPHIRGHPQAHKHVKSYLYRHYRRTGVKFSFYVFLCSTSNFYVLVHLRMTISIWGVETLSHISATLFGFLWWTSKVINLSIVQNIMLEGQIHTFDHNIV